MSATQEWIKEQFAKDSKPIVTKNTLKEELESVKADVKKLQEDISWMMRKYE
jgi:hypothetical protein